jgi:hypothetical protein
MTNIADYEENRLLDYSLDTDAHVALFTSDPTDADTGTEVSAGGYSRQTATFSAAASGSKSTSSDIVFGPATGSWGTVTHVAIYDAATAGNLKWHGPLDAAKTIASGDEFKLSSGDLTASLD